MHRVDGCILITHSIISDAVKFSISSATATHLCAWPSIIPHKGLAGRRVMKHSAAAGRTAGRTAGRMTG